MISRASAKFLRGSAQKTRLVADLIRGKRVEEALSILRFTRKVASRELEKVLRSAVANAEENPELHDVDDLYVRSIVVDQGPTLKRIQPRAMGRAFRILKRSQHVTIQLEERRQGGA
jgi:large subunit ribosomal protein L22